MGQHGVGETMLAVPVSAARRLRSGEIATRRPGLEPLEERSMLSVTLHNTYIEAGEGLAGEHDEITRLSGYNEYSYNYDNTVAQHLSHAVYTAHVNNGNWSSASTWYIKDATHTGTTDAASTAPGDGDFVHIPAGYNVNFNVEMTTTSIFNLEIEGSLTFDDGGSSIVTRTLRVGTLYVLPDGALNVNFTSQADKANIVFTDYGWGEGASGTDGYKLAHKDIVTGQYVGIDAKHFTGGLIAYGKVDINGLPQLSHETTYGFLPKSDADRGAGEQHAIGTWANITAATKTNNDTQSVITLDKRVDWKAGDLVVLPDTRRSEFTAFVTDTDTETLEIDSVGYDGSGYSQITFTTTMDPDAHEGYISNLDSNIQFYGVAGLLNRNVVLKSADAGDGWTYDHNVDRGHTMFGGFAQVHITFTEFLNLGRTDATQSVFVGDYAANPDNQNGRYAVHLHHLYGPLGTATEIAAMEPQWLRKYAFVFDGNSIRGSKKWALTLHDSHYGDVRGNVIYEAQGAGIVTEDGSEIGNHIYYNLVTNMTGNGTIGWDDGQGGIFNGPGDWIVHQEKSDLARGGSGYWFRRSGNDVVDNMAMDVAYAGYL